MKTHHREMLLHASALLHQTGDLLAELVRTVDEDRDAVDEGRAEQPRNYYVQRTAHEIWVQREWLTEREIAAKLQGIYNIGRIDERGEGNTVGNIPTPTAEESVMEFSKRAATEFVDSRLGTIDYNTEHNRNFDGAKQQAAAQSCERKASFREVKTIDYRYDEAGRVASATETLRQYPEG